MTIWLLIFMSPEIAGAVDGTMEGQRDFDNVLNGQTGTSLNRSCKGFVVHGRF